MNEASLPSCESSPKSVLDTCLCLSWTGCGLLKRMYWLDFSFQTVFFRFDNSRNNVYQDTQYFKERTLLHFIFMFGASVLGPGGRSQVCLSIWTVCSLIPSALWSRLFPPDLYVCNIGLLRDTAHIIDINLTILSRISDCLHTCVELTVTLTPPLWERGLLLTKTRLHNQHVCIAIQFPFSHLKWTKPDAFQTEGPLCGRVVQHHR